MQGIRDAASPPDLPTRLPACARVSQAAPSLESLVACRGAKEGTPYLLQPPVRAALNRRPAPCILQRQPRPGAHLHPHPLADLWGQPVGREEVCG